MLRDGGPKVSPVGTVPPTLPSEQPFTVRPDGHPQRGAGPNVQRSLPVVVRHGPGGVRIHRRGGKGGGGGMGVGNGDVVRHLVLSRVLPLVPREADGAPRRLRRFWKKRCLLPVRSVDRQVLGGGPDEGGRGAAMGATAASDVALAAATFGGVAPALQASRRLGGFLCHDMAAAVVPTFCQPVPVF